MFFVQYIPLLNSKNVVKFLGRGEGWSDQREQALTCPRETCKVVWCNERFVLTGNTCNFWSGQEKKIKYIKISATKRHQKPLIINRIYLPKQCKCPRSPSSTNKKKRWISLNFFIKKHEIQKYINLRDSCSIKCELRNEIWPLPSHYTRGKHNFIK